MSYATSVGGNCSHTSRTIGRHAHAGFCRDTNSLRVSYAVSRSDTIAATVDTRDCQNGVQRGRQMW